jgi:hypothetical protein
MRAGMRGRPTRVIFLTVFLTAAALTTRGKFSVAGDEPHYLIIDESIVSDGDLDLRNNYAESDGKWFGHESLIDDAHTRVTPWGAAWSKHDIGLPLLMLPVYAVATRAASHAPEEVLKRFRMSRGLFAYSLMGLSLITAVAYGCTRLFEALRDVAARADAPAPVAMTVTLAMALTPPVLSHAFLVFPETVAFVVVCLVLRAAWSAADDLRPRHVAGLALALGLTPWLHRKFSFFVAGLAVALVMSKPAWFARQRSGVKGLFAALFLFPQIALHAWTFAVWGSVGGPQMMDDPRFSVSAFNTGVFGLWLADLSARDSRDPPRPRSAAMVVRAAAASLSADGRVYRMVGGVLAGRALCHAARADYRGAGRRRVSHADVQDRRPRHARPPGDLLGGDGPEAARPLAPHDRRQCADRTRPGPRSPVRVAAAVAREIPRMGTRGAVPGRARRRLRGPPRLRVPRRPARRGKVTRMSLASGCRNCDVDDRPGTRILHGA